MSRVTIKAGLEELSSSGGDAGRVRRPGGGRKALVKHDPGLLGALETLVDPVTRGDPTSPLRWTCKSADRLASELAASGRPVSERTVGRLLHALGYSLPSNRKAIEGKDHPDRDAQFRHINRRVVAFQRRGQPVVSVDTKKKEIVRNYRNSGREWEPKGRPRQVKSKNFPDKELGKIIPYGVYDPTDNTGWVGVGIDHDTAEFAVETLRRWWRRMGSRVYPDATELLITADGGGSNGTRNRLWKWKLQGLADEIGLSLSVCHFPPGTSKWNKIEHRMFCHITENWRGRPLVSREVAVNLIGHTTTKQGLSIHSELDANPYPLGRKVSDKQMKSVRIKKDAFHGEWNYTISPKPIIG